MIIAPRKPNAPKEADVQAALNLMVSLGGQSETSRRFLDDLLAAIQHNTALLNDINTARADLASLEKRELAVTENEARVDGKLSELETIRQSFKAYDADYK